MKKVNTTTVLFVALAYLFVSILILLSQRNFTQKTQLLVATPTPNPTTTYWQTYENGSLKISFDYPASWSIGGFPGDEENYLNSVDTRTRFKIESPDRSISMAVLNHLSTRTLDSCMLEQKPTSIQVIGELPFTKTIYYGHCQGNNSVVVTFSNSAKKIDITFSYTSDVQTETEKTISQILSTFKFINQSDIKSPTITIFTPKNKTYTNLGVSFNYPSDFVIDKPLSPVIKVGSINQTFHDNKNNSFRLSSEPNNQNKTIKELNSQISGISYINIGTHEIAIYKSDTSAWMSFLSNDNSYQIVLAVYSSDHLIFDQILSTFKFH